MEILNAVPHPIEAIKRQLAVWKERPVPSADLAALKDAFIHSNPPNDGQPKTFYAAALMAAGRTEEARPLLRQWPLPDSTGDPLYQAAVFPQFIALRQKIGMKVR